MTTSPPIIGFELGVGEFRIVTPQAIYNIKVVPELIKANTDLGVLSPAGQALPSPAPTAPCPPAGGNGQVDQNFFQDISQELFERVGQLARQLSVSVTEIPDSAPSLSQTGADLEDAKGQLEEVVEITEKASMTIMDLADQIQADMETLNSQMGVLTNLESLLEKDEAIPSPAPPEDNGSSPWDEFKEAYAGLKAAVASLAGASPTIAVPAVAAPEPAPEPTAEPTSAPEPTAPAEPAPPTPVTTTKVVFDLDGLFQTLYEFCANESVKDHIKAMRAGNEKGTFNGPVILAALADLAATLEPDEGFYNFPIPGVLKILYSNASSEEDKVTLKKMNQTAGSIFLDANLPVEGRVEEVTAPAPAEPEPEPVLEVAPSPEPEPVVPVAATGAPEAPADGELELANLKERIEKMDAVLPLLNGHGDSYVTIPRGDRDAIVNAVAASDSLIKNTTDHLTRIMEALSFQDLSGQRIKKIVNLISEIQVQLLSLLVSVDSKIKAHKDSPAKARPKEETDKVAQAEVDRMLEKLSGGGPPVGETSELKGPGADNRLNQGAVNDLLAELGF
ncbi:MAG: protein phosphatase CheZ [Deltaproteobacteria bacterium]|jgi:chemotaxis regulatin CheY-phosphate phosphatase CheZ|nr:protein phosphatase CheZ [Deltaproteobacteria bacterium]